MKNLRNWGEMWLGTVLWDKLGLDGFWSKKLPPSRKGTDWLAIMKAIVLYRFTAPGSELEMHSNWMANTAIEELILLSARALGRALRLDLRCRPLRPDEHVLRGGRHEGA